MRVLILATCIALLAVAAPTAVADPLDCLDGCATPADHCPVFDISSTPPFVIVRPECIHLPPQ